jgi:hypothetical protein
MRFPIHHRRPDRHGHRRLDPHLVGNAAGRRQAVITDRDFTIATIAGSSAMKPEAAETTEAAAEAPAAEGEAEEK